MMMRILKTQKRERFEMIKKMIDYKVTYYSFNDAILGRLTYSTLPEEIENIPADELRDVLWSRTCDTEMIVEYCCYIVITNDERGFCRRIAYLEEDKDLYDDELFLY